VNVSLLVYLSALAFISFPSCVEMMPLRMRRAKAVDMTDTLSYEAERGF
jgi:hypothetical protein